MKQACIFIVAMVLMMSQGVQAQSHLTIDAGTTVTVETGSNISGDGKTVNGTLNGGGTWNWDLPLPVVLQSFTATAAQNTVTLRWRTATEVNNYGFNVERKTTGVWGTVGFVKGHGTTNASQTYGYADNSASGKVVYRLKQIDRDGKFEYSKELETTVSAPAAFALAQNFPNPFNPATAIVYHLPATCRVTLKVFDLLGNEAAMLVNENQEAGSYTVQFDGRRLSSGLYFYTIKAGSFTATKKFLLTK